MPETTTTQSRRVVARSLVVLVLVTGALFGLHCADDGAARVTDAVTSVMAEHSHGDGEPTGLVALCVSVTVAVLLACAGVGRAREVGTAAAPSRRAGVPPPAVPTPVDLTRLCVLRT